MADALGVSRQLLRTALAPGAGEVSDGQLLECFRAHRAEAAFAALVRRHGPMVLGVCRRVLRNEADAEDAFQATFLVLVRRAADVGKPERLGNWLYGVAYRTALEARTAAARRRRKEGSVPPKRVADENEPGDWRAALDRELSGLPEKYRAAVVLCDLEGLTRRQAAHKLGLAEGTLSGRLTTARRLLARRLRRHGVALSAGALAVLLARSAAAIPPPLISSTVKTLTTAPARVLALTDGVLKTMLYAKLKTVACLVLCAALVGFGARELTPAPAAADEAKPATAEKPPADPKPRPDEPRLLKIDGMPAVLWSPDGKLMAVWNRRSEKRPGGGADDFDYYSTIKVHDARTGKELVTLGEMKNTGLQYISFSPDGGLLALSSRLSIQGGDKVEIWDTKTGQLRDTFTLEYGRGRLATAFSPDGKTLAVTYGGPPNKLTGGARLIDVKTGKLKAAITGHQHLTVSAAFAPDGKLLATGGDQHGREIRLYDAAAGKQLRTIKGGRGLLLSLAFSRDGSLLAAADTTGGVRIWETATGAERTTFKENAPNPQHVVFSRDGKLIAAAGKVEKDGKTIGGEVRLWDVDTGELLLHVENTDPRSVGFPDERTLGVVVKDGVKLIDVGKFLKRK